MLSVFSRLSPPCPMLFSISTFALALSVLTKEDAMRYGLLSNGKCLLVFFTYTCQTNPGLWWWQSCPVVLSCCWRDVSSSKWPFFIFCSFYELFKDIIGCGSMPKMCNDATTCNNVDMRHAPHFFGANSKFVQNRGGGSMMHNKADASSRIIFCA